MVVLEALSISLVEAISGAIYNGYINSKDYSKKLCNPPGLLWLSDFWNLSELVPLRLLANISSSKHECIRKITRKTRDLPSSLQGVKKIKITNLRNKTNGRNDGNFVFDIELYVEGNSKFICACSRTKKQFLSLCEIDSFVDSLDKETLSLIIKFKDMKHDEKEQEMLQSIIDKIHSLNVKHTSQSFCHFVGFCPYTAGNDGPLHPEVISFDVGVLSTHQRLACDLNGYSLALFLLVVLRTTHLNIVYVADELNISGISLMISLLSFMTFDVIGRTQRREYLKNIEALMRWTRMVPIFSLFMILESGLMSLLFFFLVILLRAAFDSFRTIYRIVVMDPSLRNSNGVRSIAQIVSTIIVLPLVSRLINMLSDTSNE